MDYSLVNSSNSTYIQKNYYKFNKIIFKNCIRNKLSELDKGPIIYGKKEINMLKEIIENDRGKKMPTKMGLAPIQRDGLEYEFTIMFDIGIERHMATATKDRTGMFKDWCDVISPQVGEMIRTWSNGGADVAEDGYVKIEQEKVMVRTRNGLTDIVTLSYEQMQQLLASSKYALAHKAIRERVDNIDAMQEEERR